jgi:ribosome-associated heat shock protein Hsp15
MFAKNSSHVDCGAICHTERIMRSTDDRPGTVPVPSARIDQWLWSVRLAKNRADAAGACRGGHVSINGKAAKPSSPVSVGDTVEAFLAKRERVVEVRRIIVKRVGAPVAAECFVDHSPPLPERPPEIAFAERDRGAGRPTKRDRRRIDRLRGR